MAVRQAEAETDSEEEVGSGRQVLEEHARKAEEIADQAEAMEGETPVDPKLVEGLKRIGGAILPGRKCPECGSHVATLPKEGKLFEVCVGQLSEEPSCYWYQPASKESENPSSQGSPSGGESAPREREGSDGERASSRSKPSPSKKPKGGSQVSKGKRG